MIRKILVVLLSIVIGLFGILSTLGAFLFMDFNQMVRIAGIVNGGFLVVGAWLLYKRSTSAVVWLLLSAILYFMIALYDGFLTDGTIAITGFIAEFYWSLGMRVLFAAAAYALLRGVTKEGV
jgi:hypothetical protein